MDKVIKSFVTDKFPEFVVSDHAKFKLFVEAYYEWLEQQNTGSTSNVKEMFKGLPNPGALVAHADTVRDIDTTFDGFVDYFRREIIPISINDNKTTDRFFIKKIRDLYLTKGTPKSFKLLFRLLYDEDIEVFETKQNILRASYGQYLRFPVVHLQVVEFEDNLENLDFTLARITDINNVELGTVLNGVIIGEDSDTTNVVLKAQLGELYPFEVGQRLFIYDLSNSNVFVEVKVLPSLQSITTTVGGSHYSIGDEITVGSKNFNQNYSARVTDVTSGPVEHLFVRDRGAFHSVGDSIVFTHPTQQFGSSGSSFVSSVDGSGRITEVDGFPLRTGSLNNGYLSNRFQSVKVPIANGGLWRRAPSASMSGRGITYGLPYGVDKVVGTGAQITPVSKTIGSVVDLFFADQPYFTDSEDVVITPPLNVLVQNFDGIETGAIVSFQRFVPVGDAFKNDSDNVSFTLQLKRRVGELEWRPLNVRVPYDFDFDSFQWKTLNFTVDSDVGLDNLGTVFSAVKNVDFTHTYIDSDNTQTFMVVLNDVRANSFNRLEKFHYDSLSIAQSRDSDFDFSWSYSVKPYLSNDNILDVGEWQDLNKYGRVSTVRENEGFISLMPVTGMAFVDSESFVEIKTKGYKEIVRIAPIDSRIGLVNNSNLPFTNVVAQIAKAEFRFSLGSVVFTSKSFTDERGFLNSASGGVLQDNFFYSEFTYVVQTKIPLEKWRQRVKTLLHPAGTLMLSQLVIEQTSTVEQTLSSTTELSYGNKSAMTFDTSLEHHKVAVDYSLISADNTTYTSNPFEVIGNQYTAGAEITADTFFENNQKEYSFQKGDSWWDFEPLGLISDKTTQSLDSDVVASTQTFYHRFDNQHKNSRVMAMNKPLLSQTQFTSGTLNSRYYAYDSDEYTGIFATFSDSDLQFTKIDYTSVTATGRQVKATDVLRKKELRLEYERDLVSATKGTLTYTDKNLGLQKGFDAFENKWNTINGNRDHNRGWGIVGYTSHIQNISSNKRLRADTEKLALQKTPLTPSTYPPGSWVVTNTFKPSINTFDVFDFDITSNTPPPQSNDPRVISKNRKLK